MDMGLGVYIDKAVSKVNGGKPKAVCHVPVGVNAQQVRDFLRRQHGVGYSVRFNGTEKTGLTVTISKQ